MPPATPVDPPTRACFSTISGSIPESSAASAATIPPPPLTAMRRSTDVSQAVMPHPPASSGIRHQPLGVPQVGDRHGAGGVGFLNRAYQPVVWQPGEETVDNAFEVRDQSLNLTRQPHVLKTLGVQTF